MSSLGQLLQESRQKAGLTQVGAAIDLSVDLRTLQRYERDETPCPWDKVVEISRCYHDKGLLYEAIQYCDIWPHAFPIIEQHPLMQAACTVVKQMNLTAPHANTIIDIISNGQVDPIERIEWERIMKQVNALTKACMELLAADSRKGAA